ncbi:MAG TPA: hypothetical protein PKD86_00700 [Gemmatales bacterium]|nr:hypothetical protein [Gemmatales bacterium]HMP57843.1 hypothetical protein [Gemmatales bacterium]
MSKPMSNRSLSKKSTAILGVGLLALGSALVFYTAVQLDDFVRMFMNLLGAGLVGIGFMIATVAQAMKPDGNQIESPTKT